MAGIVFFRTKDLDRIRGFYIERIGMKLWLEQVDCIILEHGNLLLGFCQRDEADTSGMITFYFDTKEEVDRYHSMFRETSDGPPRINPKYDIYHFFCRDPEGRTLEFQRFLTDVDNC